LPAVFPANRTLPEPSALAQQEMIYRMLLSLQTDLTEIKGMLSELLSRLQSQKEPLLLPEGSRERLPEASATATHESLRDILNSFYRTLAQDGRIPSLEDLERYAIEETLKRFSGNKRKTAEALGITERTLYRKLNQYKLSTT
ncbi:MAG: helix-turn-helix domain-containing protein, partial [Candidatus Thermochlorobacter sp.]